MKRKLDFILGIPLLWFCRLFAKNPGTVATPPQKILVIKLAAVGDTILLISVLRALRSAHPQAEIHWLASSINQELARTATFIDRFWILKSYAPVPLLQLVRLLRKEKFDAVIDFEQWARGSAILGFLTGAPVRLGFETPGQHRSGLFSSIYSKRYNQHEILDFYGLASLLGSLAPSKELELHETEEGKNQVQFILRGKEKKPEGPPWVLIHPGCGRDGFPREWPVEQYAVLGNWLFNSYQAKIFVSGGPDETKLVSNLCRLLQFKAHDCSGKLSWHGTVSLVNQMDCVISGNTGIMHVAAALKKKQVALHGPTNSLLWGPLNQNARVVQTSCPQCPCLKLGFEYHSYSQSCMNQISYLEVKEAVRSLL